MHTQALQIEMSNVYIIFMFIVVYSGLVKRICVAILGLSLII